MIQIFCDRCKKVVKNAKEEGHENEIHFTEERNTRFGYDKRLNLCDDCIDKFWKWIKEVKT